MARSLFLPQTGRRNLLKAAAASLLLPFGRSLRPGVARADEAAPAATHGTGWRRKSQWRFGTGPGNDIARFSDWLRAGWFMNETPRWLNDECETYNTTDQSDGNPNFVPAADHCDIVAVWNGGPIVSASGNGSISSLMMRYNLPSPSPIGYYELECRIPSVSGAWPAWWMIGHAAGAPQGSSSWGPEIDVIETNDTKTDQIWSTLHGARTPSNCFMRGGGNPPGRPETPAAHYEAHPWNMGAFAYQPGNDFAQSFHRFGARIAPNYNISIWIDDRPIGAFAAEQYCDDAGKPVGMELLVNLALGTHNPDPVHSIHTADFGGANNRGPSNKFRFGLKTIQVWGP
jgi:hypothetical protein